MGTPSYALVSGGTIIAKGTKREMRRAMKARGGNAAGFYLFFSLRPVGAPVNGRG